MHNLVETYFGDIKEAASLICKMISAYYANKTSIMKNSNNNITRKGAPKIYFIEIFTTSLIVWIFPILVSHLLSTHSTVCTEESSENIIS